MLLIQRLQWLLWRDAKWLQSALQVATGLRDKKTHGRSWVGFIFLMAPTKNVIVFDDMRLFHTWIG